MNYELFYYFVPPLLCLPVLFILFFSEVFEPIVVRRVLSVNRKRSLHLPCKGAL